MLGLMVAYPVVLVLVSTSQGIGVSIDSVSYAAAATSVASGQGLLSYDGMPLTIFPPGYPLLLGLLIWLGMSLNAAAVMISVLSVALVVLATYALARRTLSGTGVALMVTAFVSLSAALTRTFSFIWSEPIFTVLVLFALLVIVEGIRQQSLRWPGIVLVATLVSLATAVRYVGLTLVPIVVVGVFLADRRLIGRRAAFLRAAAAGGLSLAGFAAVAARNVSLGSGVMGDRYGGSRTIESGLTAAMRAIGDFVAPSQTTTLTAFVGVVVGMIVLAGTWTAFLRREHRVLLIALFVIVYWATIIVSQATARLDEAGERFAVPALVPLVIVVAYALRELGRGAVRQLQAHGFATSAMRWLQVAGSIGLAVVVALSVVHGIRFARDGADQGLVRLPVTHSALVDAAVAAPGGVASNDPWSIWWAGQRGPVVDLPVSPSEWPQARVDDDINRLIEAVESGRVEFVALFDDGPSGLPVSSFESFGLGLVPDEQFPDGTFYRVTLTD